MNIYDVIIAPVETEKAYSLREFGQYVFQVNLHANKIEIRKAVEEIYDVDVESVNVMVMPAKFSRIRGRHASVRRPVWKKAIVTVAPGQLIEQLEV